MQRSNLILKQYQHQVFTQNTHGAAGTRTVRSSNKYISLFLNQWTTSVLSTYMMFQLVSPSKFFNHYPKQVQLVNLHSFQHCGEEWDVQKSVPHVFNDEEDEILTKLHNRFLWGRKMSLFFVHCNSWATKAAFPLPGQENSYTTAANISEVFSAAMARGHRWRLLSCYGWRNAIKLQQEICYYRGICKLPHALCGRNLHLSELLWQELGGIVSSPFAPCLKVLTHGDL